jgi:hypothetical protein
MNKMRHPIVFLALALGALGCGGRPSTWDADASSAKAFGLTNAVVLVDAPAHRVVALGVDDSGALTETPLPTGHDVVATAVGPLGDKLFVLSAGHRGGLGDAEPDEAPRLTIVDGTKMPAQAQNIDLGDALSDPLDGLAIDPTEHWAVVYAASGTSTAFVTNPNELVVVDLSDGGAKPPQRVVLHSFGGHPEKLIFAPALTLPGGVGHLLVAQSDQDLSLLSLDDPTKPDITVRLADATAVTRPHPAEVVFDDGDPAKDDDARMGIRFDAQTSVMTLQLQASTGPNGFAPTINVADVGGVPSAIAFVRTDGGLRLSALVPARASAVLVDLATTTTSEVALPAGYRSLSLVTTPPLAASAGAAPAAGPDVALLWNGTSALAGVAFWELGRAAGLPFRSIETVGINGVVNAVEDVPGKNDALKVLSTSVTPGGGAGGAFFVLDLGARTATPLLTATGNVSLSVSPTGARVWAFQPGGVDLAATDLPAGTVHSLRVDTPATALFEIGRPGDKHALVVLHGGDGLGATIFDADVPIESNRRIYGGLLTEGSYDGQ